MKSIVGLVILLALCGCENPTGNSPSTNPNDSPGWVWVSGSSTINQFGVYGTKGQSAGSNTPGDRTGATSWRESNGHFWLFGGYGKASAGERDSLNDLWRFDGSRWTWVSGASSTNGLPHYGEFRVSAPDNVPGARNDSCSWIDEDDNLWLFGGIGFDSTGASDSLNDLWRFDGAEWTWFSGSSVVNQSGVYGTLGIAATENSPGARHPAACWLGDDGGLYLFGGNGRDGEGELGLLNDLWRFDGQNWTWLAGSDRNGGIAIPGTKGIPAAGNTPGARDNSAYWSDTDGGFWLIGGYGHSNAGSVGYLIDIWRFQNDEWTWMSGPDEPNQVGIYGERGVPGTENTPGSRIGSNVWRDTNGNVWLFGGYGIDDEDDHYYLNDLWRFDGTLWTWISGSRLAGASGNYGTKGVSAENNTPGARSQFVSWLGPDGESLWLFGGVGYDVSGTRGGLNDLWRFVF